MSNVYVVLGDGKTHYIRKELDDPCLVIAVNESFTPLSAILKLRKLPQNYSCAIFFNFTIVPSMVCKYSLKIQYVILYV